jgi:hypothetical protein
MNKKLILLSLILVLGLSGCNSSPELESEAIEEAGSTVNSVNSASGNGPGGRLAQSGAVSRGNCLTDDCLLVSDLEYPVGELSIEAQGALDQAINDEYKALSTYEAIIAEFGSIRPFSMIKGAEEQHIASLKAIYDKYGLTIPVNNWSDKVEVPPTLQAACQLGVDAEIANASLYQDELLSKVSKYEDITSVFTNLMNASQQKHLPAFDRCN